MVSCYNVVCLFLFLLNTSIHWSFHCTVHVYVVIHFCDIAWYFWVEPRMCTVLCLFIKLICIAVWDLITKKGGTPLNGLILPHFCVCPTYTSTWISNVICRCLLCVQWFEVGGDCSFCWYRSNCWPSLFKLPCHDCIN
jgi:hypothetical protein